MAAKDFLVAIELGSSKKTGIAGRKNIDGRITESVDSKADYRSLIRKGVVYDIDKTAQCLASIVNKLTNTLNTGRSQVYLGVGGQSIRSVKNSIVKDLPAE